MKKTENKVSLRNKLGATMKPRVISLFSGCGGLDLGFHLEDYNVVWSNEFNKWAADTYELNFKGATVDRRSILEIDPYKDKKIPSADLIIGGFPCQDFSIIWKRPGLEGNRGSLYQEFLRFIHLWSYLTLIIFKHTLCQKGHRILIKDANDHLHRHLQFPNHYHLVSIFNIGKIRAFSN